MGILRKNLQILREELASYTRHEHAFIFYAMLCGFFICCEYSLIRPVSNSLFITNFSSKAIPFAWLALVPFNFALVTLYNRLLPKWGSKRLLITLVALVAGTNVLVALFAKKFAWISVFLFMWKEVYVLLMFQLLWSVIHSNIQLKKAKYLYGVFFGVGGLGSMLGGVFPGFFAVSLGSENLIFFSIPVYASLLFVYWKMTSYAKEDVEPSHEEKGGFIHGIKLIRGSRFLIFALLIVVFMQMITAVADFQFNDFLERAFSEKDLRTQYSGRVFGIMQTIAATLQFVGTYMLIKWMGYRRIHYFLPIVLALFASLLAFFPIFPIASLLFISCKALDFSVFGVVKEMLYVPLKPDEKYRAKAVIDVFAYRTAKAFSSILIILITGYVSTQMLTWLNISIALAWFLSVSYGLKEYEKLTASEAA